MDETQQNVNILKVPGSTNLCDHIDWEYSMRRDMQEIVTGVYLGPYASAMKSKLDMILSKGITHVICIRQSIEANFVRPNFPQQLKYLVLDIADSPTENIIRFFKQTNEFIEQCVASGGKVLVHGNGGISRSAAIVMAYLMVKFSLSCSEAMSWVRRRRFCVCLNEGFQHQLLEYEHIYKAQHLSMTSPQGDSTNSLGMQSRKRKDMDSDWLSSHESQNMPSNMDSDSSGAHHSHSIS